MGWGLVARDLPTPAPRDENIASIAWFCEGLAGWLEARLKIPAQALDAARLMRPLDSGEAPPTSPRLSWIMVRGLAEPRHTEEALFVPELVVRRSSGHPSEKETHR